MKKTICSLLRNVFLKQIQRKWLIIILILICSSFFSVYINFRFIDISIKLNEGYSLYGDYQIQLEDVKYSTISEIKEMDAVDKVSYYSAKIYEDSYFGKRVLIADRNVVEMYHYTLKEGQFPESGDEALCEYKYWIKYLDSKPLEECRVEIGGKTYGISGLITKTDYWQSVGVSVPDFIISADCVEKTELDEYEYLVLLQTGNTNLKSLKKQIISKFNVNRNSVHYNLDAVYFAGLDANLLESDPIYLVCDVMIYFIVLFMSGLLAALFNVFLFKLKSNIAICNALGVEKKDLVSSLLQSLLVLILPAAVVPQITALVVDALIMKSDICWSDVLAKNIILTLIFVGALLLFTVPSFFNWEGKSISADLANKDSIKECKVKKYNSDKDSIKESVYPFWRLAKYNISRKHGRRFFSVIGLALAMMITAAFLFLVHYAEADWGEYKYDYRVEYDNNNIIDTEKGVSNGIDEYEKLTQQNDFDYFSYYYLKTVLSVEKNLISDDYKQFLISQDKSMFAEFDKPKNKRITVPALVILAEESTINVLYGLNKDCIPKNGECTIVSQIKCIPNGYYDSGISVGDNLNYYNQDVNYEKQERWPSLIISKTVSTIDFPLGVGYYSLIVLVNREDYDKINLYTNYDYPQSLYLNIKDDTSAITTFFKDCTFMSVTDLREEKEYVRNSLVISEVIIYSMSIMLVMIVSVYSILAFLAKFAVDSKQLSVLKALGIPTLKRFLYLVYEFVSSLPATLILGTALSLIADYLIVKMLRFRFGYFPFSIPAYSLLIPIAAVLVSYFLVIPLAVFKMKGLNVAENLQKEL